MIDKLNSFNSSTSATNYPVTKTKTYVAVKHRIGLWWAAFGKHEDISQKEYIPI